MNGDRIEMSQRERDVLKVMSLVIRRERTQVEAGRLLGRSVRQVRRILRRLEQEGDRGVIHRSRGRPSGRRRAPAFRQQVFDYIEQEDTPRPLIFQLDLLRQVGFEQVEILHKNNLFAAFGAIKAGNP